MNVVIISGGSKGLGRALVEKFDSEHWKTIEFSRSGTTNFNIKVDFRNPQLLLKSLTTLFTQLTTEEIEHIVLINNTGSLNPIKKISQLSYDEIIDNLNINITSSFILIQTFIKYFRFHEIPKTIINISSGAALKGYPGWSLYCTGKAGIENLISTVQEEEKYELNKFIALNFDPYIMDTDMQTTIRNSSLEDFPQKEKFIRYKEDGKLLKTEMVADSLFNVIIRNYQEETRIEVLKKI